MGVRQLNFFRAKTDKQTHHAVPRDVTVVVNLLEPEVDGLARSQTKRDTYSYSRQVFATTHCAYMSSSSSSSPSSSYVTLASSLHVTPGKTLRFQLERSKVLDPAVKEVGRVLKDNLYDKFRATKEYKQIQDQMDALDEVEE